MTLSDIIVDFASQLLKYTASIFWGILICLTSDPVIAYLSQGLYLPGMNYYCMLQSISICFSQCGPKINLKFFQEGSKYDPKILY